METSTIILHIALILISARLCSEIAGRFNTPPVIGELAAGIILGPSILGLIHVDGFVQLLSEIGIILLLFQIGSNTNVGKLLHAGGKSITVAAGGVIASFWLCFLASYYLFGIDFLVSMMLAGTMTSTSIGITMRSLSDLGRNGSPESEVVLGAAVMDDILGVLLLAILFDFAAHGKTDYSALGRILLFTTIFFLLTPLIAKIFAHSVKIFEPFSTLPGIVPTSIISLLLMTAWLSDQIGLPMLLGGFVVGLALSKQFHLPIAEDKDDGHFCVHVQKKMKPIIQLFTPVFFVSIGLSVDLGKVDWQSGFFWYFAPALTALTILGKTTGALLIRAPFARKMAIGISMMPRSEVGLIFAGIGKTSGLFNDEIYVILIVVIVATILLTPFCLRAYYRRYGALLDQQSNAAHTTDNQRQIRSQSDNG